MNQNEQEKIAQRRRLLAETLRKQLNDTTITIPDPIPLIPTERKCWYLITINENNFLIEFWNVEEYRYSDAIRVPTSISGVPSDYLIEVGVSADTPNIVSLVRRGISFCIDVSDIKKQFGLTNDVKKEVAQWTSGID